MVGWLVYSFVNFSRLVSTSYRSYLKTKIKTFFCVITILFYENIFEFETSFEKQPKSENRSCIFKSSHKPKRLVRQAMTKYIASNVYSHRKAYAAVGAFA